MPGEEHTSVIMPDKPQHDCLDSISSRLLAVSKFMVTCTSWNFCCTFHPEISSLLEAEEVVLSSLRPSSVLPGPGTMVTQLSLLLLNRAQQSLSSSSSPGAGYFFSSRLPFFFLGGSAFRQLLGCHITSLEHLQLQSVHGVLLEQGIPAKQTILQHRASLNGFAHPSLSRSHKSS